MSCYTEINNKTSVISTIKGTTLLFARSVKQQSHYTNLLQNKPHIKLKVQELFQDSGFTLNSAHVSMISAYFFFLVNIHFNPKTIPSNLNVKCVDRKFNIYT